MTTSLQVPDPSKLSGVQALCEIPDPYRADSEAERLFTEAMLECTRWHGERCDFYGRLLKTTGFNPGLIRSAADTAQIPFVLANFFKTHEVLSIPRADVFGHFTSSGTTGQKSQVFFDFWSLKAGQRMLDWIVEKNGWVTPSTPTHYLLYSYETEPDSKLGTAYTDNYLCKYAPVKSVFHALRRTGTDSHEFDVFGCIEQLKRFATDGLPVRIFGYPAFLYFTLKRMRDLGMPPLRLSQDSLVFLGGGWKGHASQAISKTQLYVEVGGQLGIPDHRIRDGFGSVEHPIPYVECDHHQFHVPVWSRVFIRDLKTLEVLGTGRPGFLHFVSPYITSMPAHSVLMGDLATLHDGASCPCSLKTPYFVVHGRAGVSKNKSCAVAAAELLRTHS
jgi:phenylacetate-coenzyme A ligase PaaK-like adenylate-forming protein